MISRHWKGITYKERASDYLNHLQKDTFSKLKHVEGFISITILHREVSNGIEFLIITRWSDFDAIKKFAGPGYESAVVPVEAQRLMVEYDHHVTHYHVKSDSVSL